MTGLYILILAQSPDSWEAATEEALREASQTVRNIRNIYVKEFQAVSSILCDAPLRIRCTFSLHIYN